MASKQLSEESNDLSVSKPMKYHKNLCIIIKIRFSFYFFFVQYLVSFNIKYNARYNM